MAARKKAARKKPDIKPGTMQTVAPGEDLVFESPVSIGDVVLYHGGGVRSPAIVVAVNGAELDLVVFTDPKHGHPITRFAGRVPPEQDGEDLHVWSPRASARP